MRPEARDTRQIRTHRVLFDSTPQGMHAASMQDSLAQLELTIMLRYTLSNGCKPIVMENRTNVKRSRHRLFT